MATIGIILLIVFFVYVYHIFTKEYPPREKSIFLDYTKTGSRGIPGTTLFGAGSDRGFGNSQILKQILDHIDSIEIVRSPIV